MKKIISIFVVVLSLASFSVFACEGMGDMSQKKSGKHHHVQNKTKPQTTTKK